MSLIKKSDVENHIAPRHRKEIRLSRHESRPDATGFSVAELNAVNAEQSEFVVDYSAEHAIARMPVTQVVKSIDFIGPQAPAASKSAQT
jgi:hypothetical protein